MAYQWIAKNLPRFVDQATVFKLGFNLSPMYRRTTGRVRSVSKDLRLVEVAIPLSWRNANYVGSIFGGSMLSATDPILMVQLLNILGSDFVVWDKAVEMRFKRPARETLIARFEWSEQELEEIRRQARELGEVDYEKDIVLKTEDEGLVCAESTKTLYIATKEHYKQKRAVNKQAENGSHVQAAEQNCGKDNAN